MVVTCKAVDVIANVGFTLQLILMLNFFACLAVVVDVVFMLMCC